MIFNQIPIKSRLQFAFLSFGLLIILAAGWQAYEIGRSALEELSFHRLTSVRETKKRQVEMYFEQMRNSIITIAENPAVHRQAHAMLAQTAGAQAHLPFTVQRGDSVFSPWLDRFQLRSLAIIHPKTQRLVYSTDTTDRIRHLIEMEPYKRKSLTTVIGAAVGVVPNTLTFLTDVVRNEYTDGEAVLFLSVPMLEGRTLTGILLAEIPMENINRIMTDNDEWSERGMGASGETYIVGADHLMRTDSRFLTDAPQSYLGALKRSGYPTDVMKLIERERTTILYQSVNSKAANAALGGHAGIQIVDDYRGIPVLSSYSPLDITGLQWVILAEIDTKEAFASVAQLQENLIFTAFIMFLIAAFSGYLIALSISTPLRKLAVASEDFGKGELGARVDIDSKDELGNLADAFNTMAGNLQTMTAELQNEVRVRQDAEQELQVSHERLRQLSAYLQSVREEERKHLAREIHDELGQSLTAIKMDAAMLERRFGDGSEDFKDRIADMLALIQDTIISVKRITSELRPGILDDLGLSAAIEWQAEEFQKRTGIWCDVTLSPPTIIVEPDVSTAIFRIFQETLTNVARHAEAHHVRAELRVEENAIELEIEDDGKGMSPGSDAHQASFGILGMRERVNALGGAFDIASEAGKGTAVQVTIPLRGKDGAA